MFPPSSDTALEFWFVWTATWRPLDELCVPFAAASAAAVACAEDSRFTTVTTAS